MTCSVLPRLAAAGLLAAAVAAHAQTTPKPAAVKPGAEGKTLSLGGGTGSGKVLTRDELRACLKQQDELTKRRAEVEAARGPLDKEKEDLVKEQDGLKADRDKVESVRQSVAALNARYKDYGDRVQKWNERAKEIQNGGGGKTAERDRDALEKERVDLQKTQAALDADRAKLGDAQQAVNAFNTRAQALDKRVADWNQRNAELSDQAQAVNRDRETWTSDCADRRYREDDETAIRKGQ